MRKLLRYGLLGLRIFSVINPACGEGDGGSNESGIGHSASTNGTVVSSATIKPLVSEAIVNETCPRWTLDHIFQTLPQQCLKTDGTGKSFVADGFSKGDSATASVNSISASQDAQSRTAEAAISSDPSAAEASFEIIPSDYTTVSTASAFESMTSSVDSQIETDSPLDNSNFLSFEEWKKQNMPKEGRNLPVDGDRQRPINNALDSLGDEGEIELDFSGFGGTASGPSQHQAAYRTPDGERSDSSAPKSPTVRSKDAGKTCKERTNYASFDCAATVLKNNPECKSTSSILVENKDSYMLNTCSASNKFFIVELCNDILIDTVVLANYEFFSSIFRHFRVSVSDRYPVKIDKWRDLGTFEARNSREVQAFLIEHPQIWARYLRIEFLTHYGSEYYCPISLLRVHGTTMLEDLRPQEEVAAGDNAEDEITLEAEATAAPSVLQEPLTSTEESRKETIETILSVESDHSSLTSMGSSTTASSSAGAGDATPTFSTSHSPTTADNSIEPIPSMDMPTAENLTCASNLTSSVAEASPEVNSTEILSAILPDNTTETLNATETKWTATAGNATSTPEQEPLDSNATSLAQTNETNTTKNFDHSGNTSKSANPAATNSSSSSSPTNITSSGSASTSTASLSTETDPKQKPSEPQSSFVSSSSTSTSISSSATTRPSTQPQPPTQESFFKSTHNRLAHLEANTTLSLQYIESQSRLLAEAFSKVEKRQLATTSSFLDRLNETVMGELLLERSELERHREDLAALRARLTMVADELVWQKKMGVVQATLLLLCLGLVLFARNGGVDMPLYQQIGRKSQVALNRAGWESPQEPLSPSPGAGSPVSFFRKRRLWRSVTDPGNVTDATDSRPETRDGGVLAVPDDGAGMAAVDVNVQPPTPTRADADAHAGTPDSEQDLFF